MKTSIASALTIAIGSGEPLFGVEHWKTSKARVAFWSGESGARTLQSTMKRQAKSMGIGPQDIDVLWSFRLPKLSRQSHLDDLRKVIEQHSIKVAIVDPVYLALLEAEDVGHASNVFGMGAKLLPLSELGEDTNCTMICLHHFRKNKSDDTDMPELEDLSQAGFAEWARQWILLARRSPYNHDGRHELNMRFGGSGGHAGLVALDIEEGIREPHNPEARHWSVSVEAVSDARDHAKTERQRRTRDQKDRHQAELERRAYEALRDYPDGETTTMLRGACKMNPDTFARAIHPLIKQGYAERCEVKKPNGTYEGYKPTSKAINETE